MRRTRSNLFLFFIFILLFLSVFLLFFSISRSRGEPPAEPTEPITDAPRQSPITVVIDAGHGGEDGGTVGVDGVLEKDINLTLAKELCAAQRLVLRCVHSD